MCLYKDLIDLIRWPVDLMSPISRASSLEVQLEEPRRSNSRLWRTPGADFSHLKVLSKPFSGAKAIGRGCRTGGETFAHSL